MAAEIDSASSAPPQKFSRYRSVRQGASKPPPVFLSQNNQDVGVSRAPSRYRRARSTSKPEHPPQQNPLTPTLPSIGFATSTAQRRTTAPLGGPVARPQLDRKVTEPRESESERRRRQAQEAIIREEQAYRLRKEKEERDRIAKIQRAEQEAQQARLTEEEAAIILKENKRRDLERLEAELAAATPPSTAQSPKDRFGFFSRKKTSAARSAPPPVTRNGSMPPVLRTKSNDTPAIGIMEGGGGIVPGTDAPMSAVNAGERRVLIRCKQSSITLPITPETTPKDLVFTAANILTQNINPAGAILLESYAQLGLERRIRRYEPIRDVMNSWDRDTQNCLILENSDSPAHDRDTLEAHSIPREPPGDVRVFMYHSQKPGRWAKRNITLLSSGQIYISRKAGAKMGEKDTINLCHLSDFDIYTPTPQQIRKTLRPPKKHCYAIKSQQKTTMFLNTENFVHFFCTDDETLANEWYSAVQAWRSWYLVHKKGEGRKLSKSTTQTSVTTQSSLTAPEIRLRPATKAGPNHARQVSVDENPYTIGSFTPLINPERFESPPSLPSQPPPDYEEYDSEDENRPRQIPFHLRNVSPEKPHTESKRYRPPVSYRGPLDTTPSDGEFATGGLLGRIYTLRQKAQQEREKANGPFVEGPSLINNSLPPTITHHRSNSIRNNSMRNNSMRDRPVTSGGPRPVTSGGQNASGLQRTPSKREKPAPLLDFTPTFVEAPQWNKAGKGHGVAAPLGVPLVEAATNPEMGPMDDIPKATTLFRREEPLATRPATARPPTSGGRTRSLQGAFVKGGLIGKIEAENAGNSK